MAKLLYNVEKLEIGFNSLIYQRMRPAYEPANEKKDSLMRYLLSLCVAMITLTACNLETRTTVTTTAVSNLPTQVTAINNATVVSPIAPTSTIAQNLLPTTDPLSIPTATATLVDILAQPTLTPTLAPTSDNQPLPTRTPSSGGSEPEGNATVPIPVTSSDDCQPVASASGLVVDAQQERAQAPRTLPNGMPFPNVEPRAAGFGSAMAFTVRSAAPQTVELMIQFTTESSMPQRNDFIALIGGTIVERIPILNTYTVSVFPDQIDVNNLPPSPIVSHVEINEIAQASQETTIAAPNDSRYGEQWALPVVGLPAAWDNLPATSVTVAVIDSGVCMNHPDLQGRILPGFDFVDNDADPTDVYGHGCGVAGVIAANGNNGQGIAGVAPNVQIMPLRVLDESGLGSYSRIANAIVYAVDNGAQIINLSLAGPTSSAILEAAVAYAVESNVIVIAAAGNFAQPRAYYPAAYPSVIAVGSVDPVTLSRSSFSNYGADVDVWAPGRDILTTNMIGDYEFVSGTSFAAPIVAGITALSESFGTTLNTENGVVFLYPPGSEPNCP